MIYLDHAATTPLRKEAFNVMLPYFAEHAANANALYAEGRKARSAIDQARGQIADAIHAKSSEIYFTGGGSESDNWALFGVMRALEEKNHIITTRIEHHAILNACAALESLGYDVTYVPVDQWGRVSPQNIEKAIRPETGLVSVMAANNEVGTIQPIAEIARIAHAHGVLMHTDAVQAMCHVPINVTEMNIDLLSASAHKFHGPKGVGFMYMKNTAKLEPFIHGGAQERARRAGTSNVPGIVGMGQAVKLALCTLDKDTHTIINMRNYIVDRILGEIPDVTFDGPCIDANADINAVSAGLPMCSLNRLPSNMHFCFKDVSGDSLLIMLDMNGICASSGSACAAGSIAPSHVLLAIGRSSDEAKGALRLSIDKDLTKEDADYAIDALKAAVARLRR